MGWTEILEFVLGYLVTPALAVGAAALVIHLILVIQSYRTARAIRADSLVPLLPPEDDRTERGPLRNSHTFSSINR